MGYYYSKGLPTLYEIRKCIPEIKTSNKLEAFLTKTIREDKCDEFLSYKSMLIIMETLLKYRPLYTLEEYYELIWVTLESLQDTNFRLYRYVENARKKLDYDYRLQAQKKYIHYIISISELGKDIAGVICGYL